MGIKEDARSIFAVCLDRAGNLYPRALSKAHAQAMALLTDVEVEIRNIKADALDPDSRTSMEKLELKLCKENARFRELMEAREILQNAVKVCNFALRIIETESRLEE